MTATDAELLMLTDVGQCWRRAEAKMATNAGISQHIKTALADCLPYKPVPEHTANITAITKLVNLPLSP